MGHAPVITSPRRLLGLGKDGAKHYGVSTGGKGFAEVSAVAEAAVGDYGDISSRLALVFIPGSGAVHGGGYLGDTNAEDLPGGAGCPGPTPTRTAEIPVFIISRQAL